MSKKVLNGLISGKYYSNAVCESYGCLLDSQLVKNDNLNYHWFNFGRCLSTVKTVKINSP